MRTNFTPVFGVEDSRLIYKSGNPVSSLVQIWVFSLSISTENEEQLFNTLITGRNIRFINFLVNYPCQE